jgi:tetratricopeptide (TPR) repeat protein
LRGLWGLRVLPIALATLVPAAARPAQRTDLDALLTRAVELHQAGHFGAAAEAYEQVLLVAPAAAAIRSNLGAVYVQLGRFDDAINQYQLALLVAEDASVRYNLALAFQKAGRLPQAAEAAARILAAEPENRGALLLEADCRLRLGESEKVVELLTPWASRSPDDKAVAHLMGTALLELGRTGEAEVVLDRLFRDDSPEAHLLLGTMHAKRRDWQQARQELETARAGNPDLPYVSFLYGESLMHERNDWAGAAAAFREELRRNPNHFESNLLLGNLLREEGRHEQALELFERAARQRPNDLAVRFSLGAVYLALGRLGQAQPLLEEVKSAAPGHLPTRMLLAVLYTRLGRTEDATAQRQAVARLQKESEARSFQGVRETLSDLLGKSASPNP